MDMAHGEPLVLQFLDPDIAEVEVVGFPVILQGNVSFRRAVTDAGLFSFAFLVELMVDDLLAIELDLKVVTLAGYDHLVPFSRLLGHILGRPDRADDAPMIVMAHLVVGLAGRVEDLALDTCFYGILWIADAEIDAAVAAFGILVFHLENEILVLLFGRELGIVALPTLFAGARMNKQGTVLLRNPIARRFPTSQILAVVKGDKTVLSLVVFGDGEGGEGGCKDK